MLSHSKGRGSCLQVAAQRTIAGNHQHGFGSPRSHHGEPVQQVGVVLHAIQAGDVADHQCFRTDPQIRPPRGAALARPERV